MTLDKFVRRSQAIAVNLSKIALHREQLEGNGSLRPMNPRLRELLSAQERLLCAAEGLLEQLPEQGMAA